MEQPAYTPLEGIRATMVDGAENLLKQGDYYVASGRIVIKCPLCRVDNMTPPSLAFKTANWIQRLLGIRKGLTMNALCCWRCRYGFKIADGQISTTNGPIQA